MRARRSRYNRRRRRHTPNVLIGQTLVCIPDGVRTMGCHITRGKVGTGNSRTGGAGWIRSWAGGEEEMDEWVWCG